MPACFRLEWADALIALFERIILASDLASDREIKPPWDAFWGHRYACVSDPGGNLVDLFAGL